MYPANRIRSDGRPQRIQCYKLGSIDSGLWCWDPTTQAASDEAPSQHWGSRGVLSFSFEVRVRQGRVTLPCKSLRGVRAPNSMKEVTMSSKWIRCIHRGQVGKRWSPWEKAYRYDPEDKSYNAGRPEYTMHLLVEFSMEPTKEDWPSSVRRVRLLSTNMRAR